MFKGTMGMDYHPTGDVFRPEHPGEALMRWIEVEPNRIKASRIFRVVERLRMRRQAWRDQEARAEGAQRRG